MTFIMEQYKLFAFIEPQSIFNNKMMQEDGSIIYAHLQSFILMSQHESTNISMMAWDNVIIVVLQKGCNSMSSTTYIYTNKNTYISGIVFCFKSFRWTWGGHQI